MNLTISIKNKIQEYIGEKIVSAAPVGGGCISDSQIVKCESGASYFLKVNESSAGFFLCEANGLNELKKANAVRVPEVILADKTFILLEHIKSAKPAKNFFEEFGEKFASLHKYTADQFGFLENNFIGSTPQINLPLSSDWKSFYWENRILYQINL